MLNVLQSITQELSRIQSLDGVLSTLVTRVAEHLDAQVCNIFLINKKKSHYQLSATCGLDQSWVGQIQIQCGDGLVSLVGERGAPINVTHAMAHERFYSYTPLDAHKYHAFLGVPIMHQGRLLGVLTVLRYAAVRFDEAEESFLVTLSIQLSSIIAFAQVAGDLSWDTQQPQPQPVLERVLHGLPTSPKTAIGQAVMVYPLTDLDAVPERHIDPEDMPHEVAFFQEALEKTRSEMRVLSHNIKNHWYQEEQALFDAYLQILESQDLEQEIIDQIHTGLWAQSALKKVISKHVQCFDEMDEPYLRARGADIKDLGRRVLSHLQQKERIQLDYPEHTILMGEEVTPADIAEVPEGALKGLFSAKGAINAHVAIIARALGIPSVMGVHHAPFEKIHEKEVIVDGFSGQIIVCPGPSLRRRFQHLIAEEQALDGHLALLRDQAAQTQDGYGLSLYVNMGLAADTSHALRVGADGVGLYRTEMPFMVRDCFPSEEEQRVIYRQVLKAFAPRPVMMRTLDVGGDKVLPYFPVSEDNPFLGWRGIRITLDHPEILRSQIRAMLKADIDLNNLHMMFPMMSHMSEVDEVLRFVHQAVRALNEEGFAVRMPVLGAMIEVPAAVYQARAFAKRLDFLSVGTNDLVQYLLAVDRNNARVAKLYDHLHPAVLKALKQTVDSAHAEGKHVSICGEMAGDPMAVILLLALGFDTLSVSASRLPRVKWTIRQFTMEKARLLLETVMGMDNATSIHHHMEMVLDSAGLGNLIRSGN